MKADAPEKVTFSLSSALGAVADATANTIDLDGTFVTIATKGPKDEVEDNGDTANAPDDAITARTLPMMTMWLRRTRLWQPLWQMMIPAW